MTRQRLCFVTAVPMSITAFLNPHIERLADRYDVTVISDFSQGDSGVSPRAARIHAAIPRDIAPWRDMRALTALWRIFREQRFDIVHSVTPKAGLLAMTAAALAGVPFRIHWFTGQVWATRQGLGREVLKQADRMLCRMATGLLADSPSQRDFLAAEGIYPAARIHVIGDGSICGVDAGRFRPQPDARALVLSEHGIPESATVTLFLGRLNADKGIRELADAINRVCPRFPDAHFLIVGPDEGGMTDMLRETCAAWSSRLHFQGFTREPERYMAAADIFCLPSYREGFGSSVLEAAACGAPAVATRIYGLTDAVEDGAGGLLVPPRDPAALAEALAALLSDPDRRRAMGLAARERAITRFSRERIVAGLASYYSQIAGA